MITALLEESLQERRFTVLACAHDNKKNASKHPVWGYMVRMSIGMISILMQGLFTRSHVARLVTLLKLHFGFKVNNKCKPYQMG
jgi:hypothetical protein